MITVATMAAIAIISTFETLITKGGMITLVNRVAVNVNTLCVRVKCVVFFPPFLTKFEFSWQTK